MLTFNVKAGGWQGSPMEDPSWWLRCGKSCSTCRWSIWWRGRAAMFRDRVRRVGNGLMGTRCAAAGFFIEVWNL